MKKEFQLLTIINLVEANNYQSHLKKGFAIVLNDQREIIRVSNQNFNKKRQVTFS